MFKASSSSAIVPPGILPNIFFSKYLSSKFPINGRAQCVHVGCACPHLMVLFGQFAHL